MKWLLSLALSCHASSSGRLTYTGWLQPRRWHSFAKRSETTCSEPANRTHLAWRGSGRMGMAACSRLRLGLVTNDPQLMLKSLEDTVRVGEWKRWVGAAFFPGRETAETSRFGGSFSLEIFVVFFFKEKHDRMKNYLRVFFFCFPLQYKTSGPISHFYP